MKSNTNLALFIFLFNQSRKDLANNVTYISWHHLDTNSHTLHTNKALNENWREISALCIDDVICREKCRLMGWRGHLAGNFPLNGGREGGGGRGGGGEDYQLMTVDFEN